MPVAAIRSTAAAQGGLEGAVYDPTGAVVPEVRLALLGPLSATEAMELMIGKVGGGKKAQATTDAEGRFVFPAVEPGKYVLAAELPGFRTLRQDSNCASRPTGTASSICRSAPYRKPSTSRDVAAAAQARGAGPVRVRVGGNIRPPRKTKDVKPVYPESMQEAGQEGVVSIEAVIGRDGSVTAARVTAAQVHPDLASAALDAVRQWKFEPTLLNGGPVEVVMTVSVSFKLE